MMFGIVHLILPGLFIHFKFLINCIATFSSSRATINIVQQSGLQYLFQVNGASSDGINRFYEYNTSLTNSSNYDYVYGYFVISQNHLVVICQAFDQHFGNIIANQVFGYAEYNYMLQGKTWRSSAVIARCTKSPEQFEPTIVRPDDYLFWIPVGLINDLMDNNTDP